jgi:hypothetical protein
MRHNRLDRFACRGGGGCDCRAEQWNELLGPADPLGRPERDIERLLGMAPNPKQQRNMAAIIMPNRHDHRR